MTLRAILSKTTTHLKKIILSFSITCFIVIAIMLYITRPIQYEHKLAICAIFKNEAPFLKEWIEYHRLIGTSHFYLYNNESDDQYLEVLSPYIQEGIVEVIEWGNSEYHAIHCKNESTFDPYRIGAYNHCLKTKALKKSQWVAIIDIDEFLVPVHGAASLLTKLDEEVEKKTGSLQLHWRIFGTSNIWELEAGDLLVERLRLKAPDHHPWNAHVKSIHRPEAVHFILVHEAAQLNKKYGKKVLSDQDFRVHHYWTGVEKRMLEKRGTHAEIKRLCQEFNSEEDLSMIQYIPALKEALSTQYVD